MSEMIERVARAIYEGRNGRGCKPWGLLTKAHKEPYQKDARAAIEAMREPTFNPEEVSYHAPMTRADWWRSMIDAALSTSSVSDEHREAKTAEQAEGL